MPGLVSDPVFESSRKEVMHAHCVSATMAEVTSPVMDGDRGCSTQTRTRVSDAEKWLQSSSSGLHRVIFYGDYVQTIERMGRIMGFELVREA